MQIQQELGFKGETLVANYLKKQGFTIRALNYRQRYGEIDIIAIKDEVLVFVEVKLRQADLFHLSEVVSPSKQRKIIMTAQRYIVEHNMHETVQRFDIALLHAQGGDYAITYIPNAFTASCNERWL